MDKHQETKPRTLADERFEGRTDMIRAGGIGALIVGALAIYKGAPVEGAIAGVFGVSVIVGAKRIAISTGA